MTKEQRSALQSMVLLFALVGLGCAEEGLNSGGKGGSAAGAVTGTGGMVGTGGSAAGGTTSLGGTGGSFGTGGVAAGGTSGGAGGATTTVPPTCTVGGKTYQIGESFKEDCNTCTCSSSGVACTLMACIPGPDGGADALAIDAGPAPDGRVVCTYNSATMLPGESVFDGCNTCSCGNNGTMMCTARACPVEDAAPVTDTGLVSCTLSSNLTFGHNGGMVVYQDENRLTAATFTITRSYMRGASPDASATTCSPRLPACGAIGVVSVPTINADLADADVQAAWKTAQSSGTLYGTDPRPVDGTVYAIALDDGRTLLVGGQCASPTMSSCRYIPAGLVRLVQDLMSLATAMAADPACKGL